MWVPMNGRIDVQSCPLSCGVKPKGTPLAWIHTACMSKACRVPVAEKVATFFGGESARGARPSLMMSDAWRDALACLIPG